VAYHHELLLPRIPRPRTYTDGSNDMTKCILHHAVDTSFVKIPGTYLYLSMTVGVSRHPRISQLHAEPDWTHVAEASLCLEKMPQHWREILTAETVVIIMGRNVRTSPTIRSALVVLRTHSLQPTTASWPWEAQIDRFVVTEAMKWPWRRNNLSKYDRGNSIAMVISFFDAVTPWKTRRALERDCRLLRKVTHCTIVMEAITPLAYIYTKL
jgi:hypothetical protein